jgi:glutaredoxin-related protein
MVSRLIKLAVLTLVIVVIVQSLPDIKRYLEIRDM